VTRSAELEPKILSDGEAEDADDDDFPVGMAPVEQLIHTQHPGASSKGDFAVSMPRFSRLLQNPPSSSQKA